MVSNKFRILTALEHFQLAILMLPSPFSAESISIGCKQSVCLQLCDFVVVRGGGVIHRCPAPFLLHHHHQPPRETTADRHLQFWVQAK